MSSAEGAGRKKRKAVAEPTGELALTAENEKGYVNAESCVYREVGSESEFQDMRAACALA